MTELILKSLTSGDLKGFIAFVAIFALLWVQMRGMKKAIESLTIVLTETKGTMQKSFADGEKRFEHIEDIQLRFERRVTALELLNKGVH